LFLQPKPDGKEPTENNKPKCHYGRIGYRGVGSCLAVKGLTHVGLWGQELERAKNAGRRRRARYLRIEKG